MRSGWRTQSLRIGSKTRDRLLSWPAGTPDCVWWCKKEQVRVREQVIKVSMSEISDETVMLLDSSWTFFWLPMRPDDG